IHHQRSAQRLLVSMPTVVEKLGPRALPLHPILVPIYERVATDASDIGLKFPAAIKDLSTNGCFIAGLPVPLLSRVAFTFPLPGFGQVDALGWVLWRRRAVDVIAGLGVMATAGLYLASPTWRTVVVVDETGLALVGPKGERFRVAWSEVVEVIADEEEGAALVRAPEGRRSFLVPSSGHPAPYRVERGEELFARVVAAVPAEKVRRSKTFR